MKIRRAMTVVLASLALASCRSEHSVQPSPKADTTGEAKEEAASLVEVSAGKQFNPPVRPEQLPKGSWFCEMGGTVHWAQPQEGDRQCPLCRMELKHKE
jgi:hypothetical protein